MTTPELNKSTVIKYTIKLFAEKSELLAVNSYDLYFKEGDIFKIIGFIILHQSAELCLKACCINNGISIIIKGGKTITFEEALNRNSNSLSSDEKLILNILNNKRNAFQHDAIFDVSNYELDKNIFLESIFIVKKLLNIINFDSNELDYIINKQKGENNGKK